MTLKQMAVNTVFELWCVMPRRLRLWAFMNDGPGVYWPLWGGSKVHIPLSQLPKESDHDKIF